ncbi:MAG: hypothetical protein GEU26_12760 [Nitrososphaeraceae archaeon]|nr:hypothetical protein [Nitrososphaeraceae archaeon]
MVLQSLRKSVDFYKQKLDSITNVNTQQLELLKGLPFYSDWNTSVKDFTQVRTFNHAIGLPQKNGQSFPLFDYEQLLYNELQNNKHVWIKKATGLGITEFMLRYMAWLCLRSDEFRGSQMCIITGPREDLAIGLIDRMKGLFMERNLSRFDTKETVIELNGCHIEAYPSNHLDSMRGLKDVSFIFMDEADFFRIGEQQNARDVSERYIAKSDPWIVMVSTPNAPEGLFERIEKEPESTCLYKRLFLDYTYGLGKIYTEAEIVQARRSPSFEREYNLKYLGLIGNVFHTKDIEAAILKGRHFKEILNSYTQKSVGLDPGFGSSAFGVCITELVDGMINVLHAEEYPRPDFNQMISTTIRLLDEYNITFEGRSRIFVDGANPSFIRALKERLEEDTNYEQLVSYLKKQYSSVYDLEFLQQNMFVIPVPFAKYHKEMLAHCKEMMEYRNGYVAINPRHSKLITALRTAVENGEGMLDKEATSHDDLFDAFRMSLQFWH